MIKNHFIKWCVIVILSFCLLLILKNNIRSEESKESNPSQTKNQSIIKVKPQADWRDSIIYFVLIDRFADGNPSNNRNVDIKQKGFFHGGDFKGLTEQLDEIADLGATAIWINPIVKNIDHYVDAVGFPDWAYHGYWADDFYKLDERFGTEDDLKNFLEQAHNRNIKVLLDVVYNHCGYGAQYLKQPYANEWLRTGRTESPCGEDDLTQCLLGLPDFKTEKKEVADYLLKANIGMAKRFGIDGFRLDTVKHVDHDFWQAHRKMINQEINSDFFLLGEVWGADYLVLDQWFQNNELNAGFDFSFKGSVQAFVQGQGRSVAFSRYLMKRHNVRKGYYLSQYLSSHDVPGALYELNQNKENYKLCVALMLTNIGVPMIYYGEEVGRLGGDWPDNRSDMPWGDRNILPGKGIKRDDDLRLFFKKLIQIRRSHPCLWQGDYKELYTEGDLLVFSRNDELSSDTVIVAVNRSDKTLQATLALPEKWKNKTIVEGLSEMILNPNNNEIKIEVPQKTAQILLVR